MSAAPQTIARKPQPQQQQQTPGGPALDFEALRTTGIALAQAASGQLWTDYNLHDPGVTLLEALCYALTEDIYGAQQSVPELLGWPEGQVLPERHGLHRPEQILPCRPITAADYRRALLARCPGALQLRLQACEQGLPGLWRLALLAQEGQIDAAQRAFWSLRNLGEDLDGAVRRLKPRPHRLVLELDIEGPRELAELLGEIAQRAADFIAARPRWRPADTALDPALRFEGPALPQGWISDAELQRGEQTLLYFSDLVMALQGIEGLASVRRLQLVGESRPEPGADAVRWGDEDGALCLQWPRRAEDLTDWVVWRGGARQTLPEQNLLRRLAQLQVAHEHPLPSMSQAGGSVLGVSAAAPERPPYYPALLQLPAIYAHPESLGEQRHRSHSRAGQRAQWLAYAALLEQWLAHGQAQRQQLGALYSLAVEAAPSYWWQPLGETHLPGLAELQEQTPAEQLKALEAEDHALERRGRVLDQLLALHGEALPQSGLRGLPCYFSPAGFERHLLRLKQTLAAGIERFTRDRHAGFDYSRPSFGHPGNTAPLQERLSLQLGFAQHHSRSLMAPLREQGLSLADEAEQAKAVRHPEPGAKLRPLQLFGAAPQRSAVSDRRPWNTGDRLDPALLRCAVHASRYQWQEQSQLLWLGPDEQQRWWPLGRQADAAAAQDLALALHGFACGLQQQCEGLHLVEHLLLRPPAAEPLPPDVPDDFYAQQLSVVLPAWTARCADPRLQALAAQTLAELAPAHLQTHCLWLQPEALQAFELALQGWLLAKRALCEGQAEGGAHEEAAQRRLATRAAALRRLLWQQISSEAAR
jgi:hypothetical protein